MQIYPPSDPPPPPAPPTSTGTLGQAAPATPSAPLPSQYLAPPGTPTPSSAAVASPQPLEKAIFAPLVQKLKKSLVPLTYNEETDDAEEYSYPFKDEALTTPYHPQELTSVWQLTECPPIQCFCPAAGATYAQSYIVRVFKCSNGNQQWNGVWLAACAQRRCGFWLPFGVDGVSTIEMDFVVRASGQLPGFYCPLPTTSGSARIPRQVSTSTPQRRLPALTTFALNGLEGFASGPNAGGGVLVGMGPNSDLNSGPATASPSSPAKASKAGKSKAKSKSANPSMNLATMLSQIPNLGEIVATALGHQGFNLGENSDTAGTNQATTSPVASIDRSPTPEYVRLPVGPNIGAIGLPVRPSRRGASHPYARNSPPPAVIARESAVANEIGRRIDGLFRNFNTEPPVERAGHAMSFYFQMNDDDFPGVTPRQFTDTFWQCPHCKRILTMWRMKTHQLHCSVPTTEEY